MLNTDTTSSNFNPLNIKGELPVQLPCDSICLLQEEPTSVDTIIISPIERQYLPQVLLKGNDNMLADLIFTTVFLIVFAFVRLRGKDLLPNLLNVIIKRKKAEIVLNEGISSNLVCYILSLLLSFSVIATGIVYLSTSQFQSLPIFYIFLGLTFYHFFLLGLVKMLGWTFNARNTAAEAIVNLWTYHIMGGLLIAPFVIALFFVKSYATLPLLNIVVFGAGLFLFVKLLRWVEILFAHRVLILYMILYLCALEVMPLLILYKITA